MTTTRTIRTTTKISMNDTDIRKLNNNLHESAAQWNYDNQLLWKSLFQRIYNKQPGKFRLTIEKKGERSKHELCQSI